MMWNNSLVTWALIGVFCLNFSGCDIIYRMLQKEGAEEKELIGEIVPGQVNATVEEAQKLLKLYGYRLAKADGLLGPQTRMALGAFQEENGIKKSQFLDKATWKLLHRFDDPQLVVGGQINIRTVQVALKKSGFDPGKIDDRPGPQTLKAIKEFQKACGLKVDGKIGYNTLSKLAEYLPLQNPL